MAMVSTVSPNPGASSHTLWFWAVGLTAVGMIGVAVDFFGGTSAAGVQTTPGCGGGIGILIFLLLLLALAWGFVGLVGVVGAILLWFRPNWGALVLISINLLSFYLIAGSQSVYAGQLVWGAEVLVLAAIPPSAIAVLLWPLWTRGNRLVLALQLLILGALAVPVVLTAVPGLATDVNSAFQAAPAPQVASHAGCGATTGFIVGAERP